MELNTLIFELWDSYDCKDWDRLRAVIAPKATLDFRSLGAELSEDISPEQYADIIKNQMIGDPKLKTQHLVGAIKWKALDDGTVQSQMQLRVAHQRYSDDECTQVVNKGHGIGATTHLYRKVDGAWKIALNAPRLDWSEYDLWATLNPDEETTKEPAK